MSPSSQWYDKLQAELKYFDDIKIDIDKLILQSRETDKIRGQMTVLERRIQVCQEMAFVAIAVLNCLQTY